MLLETAQIMLSNQSNRILNKSPDTCTMVITYVVEESYVTEIGVIKETVKKYH